ncbi:hypothetical protein ACP275_07G045500 [Erythranthe tilingii]
MPSSHSATVTALSVAVGLQNGFGGSSFAISPTSPNSNGATSVSSTSHVGSSEYVLLLISYPYSFHNYAICLFLICRGMNLILVQV